MDEFPTIELRYLHYFIAVAEELSFRKAAERLHVTASALSMQIKKLEDMLGVKLCRRSTKKLYLTPEGEVLLKGARNLLQNSQKLMDSIKNPASKNQDSLLIGLAPLFGRGFIMSALRAYRLSYPDREVEWVQVDTRHELSEALENGQVQMGFAYDFDLQHMENVEHGLIMDSPVHVVMGAHHPLAAMERVPLANLAGQRILCFRHSWLDYQDLPALLKMKHGQSPNVRKVRDCSFCILNDIDDVTLLSEQQAIEMCRRVIHRPIAGADSNLRVRLHAVWKKNAASLQISDFLDLLKEGGERSRA